MRPVIVLSFCFFLAIRRRDGSDAAVDHSDDDVDSIEDRRNYEKDKSEQSHGVWRSHRSGVSPYRRVAQIVRI
jgi:hypothetical protein